MEGEIKFIMETTEMVPTWEGVVLNCPWFSNMRQEYAERGRYKEDRWPWALVGFGWQNRGMCGYIWQVHANY